jgi:peptidoglycan/xylan/chitin deacetylase (PgdA/CDA1 family)
MAGKSKDEIKAAFAWTWLLVQKVGHSRPKRVILYYHGITKEEEVSFCSQMKYLSQRCRVVRAQDILIMENDPQRPIVAITFDDAFVSVFELALPILKKYNFSASIFVPTGWLGRTAKWNIYGKDIQSEMVVDAAQLQKYGSDGTLDFFSHTINHVALSEIDEQTLLTELKGSKETLEDILGKETLAISYPYGKYNDKVINAARKAGYKLGFTIEPKTVNTKTLPLEIGRFAVHPQEGLSTFGLKSKGAYEAINLLQQTKRCLLKKGGK